MTTRTQIIALLAAVAAAPVAGASEQPAEATRRGVVPQRMAVHRVDLGTTKAQQYVDGAFVDLPTEQVWQAVCGSDRAAVSQARLAEIAQTHAAVVAAAGENTVVIDNPTRGAGIDIVFNLSGSIPAGAPTSFQLAEAFYEGLFGDPITVQINVSFSNLGGGVLGATSPFYQSAFYTAARAGLVADMDLDDTLQTSLPVGSTLPVRYNASSATVTNENVVWFTRSGYRACIGTLSGRAADMTLNSAFNWDFDPTNGVGGSQQSLTDVIIHEVGHVLGFISGVDFRVNDIDSMDLLRFQRTDGSGNYNPDTLAQFGTTPRTVDFNNPNDDANSDLIVREHRMSDGDPWQASHFREQGSNIGIMDPAQANGETYVGRGYFTQADLDIFDFIGYDYPPCAAPTFTQQPQDQDLCQGGTIVLSAAAGEPVMYQWMFNGSDLTNGGDISGATSSTLTIANAVSGDSGLYAVRITANDDGCTVDSLGANVQVDALPIIFGQPPATQDKNEGETLSLFVSSIDPLYTFQWRRNGVDLVNGGRISGADASTLTVTDLETGDAGNYDVVLTDNATGCEVTSTVTVVTVQAVGGDCPADCDGNGMLTLDDVDCFIAAFFGSSPEADCDGSGMLTLDDVDCFITAFFAGCP